MEQARVASGAATTPKPHGVRLPSLRVVTVYTLVATLWILLSDAAASRLFDGERTLTRVQTLKGWAFVLLSAALLYRMISRALTSAHTSHREMVAQGAQLKLLLDQAPITIWMTDKDLRTTSIAGRAAVTNAKWIGRTVAEWRVAYGPAADAVLEAHLGALRGSSRSFTMTAGSVTAEGVVAPVRDDAGELIGCIGISLDVTERVSLERENSESIRQVAMAFEKRERALQRLASAEQEERSRLAEGIHDDPLQMLAAAGMALDLLETRIANESQLQLVRRARQLIGEGIKRLRTLIFELRPISLEENGIAAALRVLLEQMSEEADFSFEIQDRKSQPLDPETRYVVYRIAREALANVRKHASAKQVTVSIDDCGEGCKVVVDDDGIGFDPTEAGLFTHFGLRDMRDRAAIAGGWCNVTSAPGKGTRVEIWVPRQAAAVPESA